MEIESCDVNFIENDFPTRGGLQKDFHLLEMNDPDNGNY